MRGLKRLPSTIDARTLKSHLLQMRGLKPARNNSLIAVRRSHLLQMRGLKPCGYLYRNNCYRQSHLLQMRGLKPGSVTADTPVAIVASFTDAWIETSSPPKPTIVPSVASFTDAWIETKEMRHQYQSPKGRIFYRCVD